jgi:hypothetical protein
MNIEPKSTPLAPDAQEPSSQRGESKTNNNAGLVGANDNNNPRTQGSQASRNSGIYAASTLQSASSREVGALQDSIVYSTYGHGIAKYYDADHKCLATRVVGDPFQDRKGHDLINFGSNPISYDVIFGSPTATTAQKANKLQLQRIFVDKVFNPITATFKTPESKIEFVADALIELNQLEQTLEQQLESEAIDKTDGEIMSKKFENMAAAAMQFMKAVDMPDNDALMAKHVDKDMLTNDLKRSNISRQKNGISPLKGDDAAQWLRMGG